MPTFLLFGRIMSSSTVNSDTIGSATFLWNFGLGFRNAYDLNQNGYDYDSTLADWQAALANAVVIGFSSGIGSGWNTFSGAVDNIGWTINGQTTTTNFELAGASSVPEPSSLALVAASLFGLRVVRRQRQGGR